MMIGKDKTVVWSNITKRTKRELIALRKIDPKGLSESQVVQDALAHYLPKLKRNVRRRVSVKRAEVRLTSFRKPTYGAPGNRKRKPRK